MISTFIMSSPNGNRGISDESNHNNKKERDQIYPSQKKKRYHVKKEMLTIIKKIIGTSQKNDLFSTVTKYAVRRINCSLT